MNSPKISVIMPVYNGAGYLARTLKRVLRQQNPAHEIIVINDGSTGICIPTFYSVDYKLINGLNIFNKQHF